MLTVIEKQLLDLEILYQIHPIFCGTPTRLFDGTFSFKEIFKILVGPGPSSCLPLYTLGLHKVGGLRPIYTL